MREHRNKLGISLNDLSKKVGVPVWILNDWERGKNINSQLFKNKIASICEVLFSKQEDLCFPEYKKTLSAPVLLNPKAAKKPAPVNNPKLNDTVKVATINTPNFSEPAPASVNSSMDELIRAVKELRKVSKNITVNFNITVNPQH